MNSEYDVWVGNFANPAERQIYGFHYVAGSGSLTPFDTVPCFDNPSYIIAGNNPTRMYAVSDSDVFSGMGGVASFAWNKETDTIIFNKMLPTDGSSACHLVLDNSGRYLYEANYGNGTISGYKLDDHGEIVCKLLTIQHEGNSAHAHRQAGPHAHCVVFTPDGEWLCTADLGTDSIEMYRFSKETGLLELDSSRTVAVTAGMGPRHIAFHPDGKHAYAVCELSSSVIAMNYDACNARLEPFQYISTLPDGWQGESSGAAIRVSTDGRFVYASNRGHDSIAIFAVNNTTGGLSLVDIIPSGGQCPRDIAIDPSGKYLFAANQESNTITRFELSPVDGTLTQTGEPVSVPHPSCICFVNCPTA